jgi:NADP-dependent 3-hydroxy acid dehydrogenase YdfG
MNKVAIVTGAGTGVGKATAVKLCDSGFIVILIGRRKDKLEETKTDCNGEALVFPMDVSNERDVKKCFEIIEKKFSRIDLLFNNAGTFLSSKTIDEINFNEWKKVIGVNLNGMFLFSKYAFSLMKNQSPIGGRIINNGSVSSITPRPGSIAYTATKHAVTGITKSLALDGRPFSIVCSQIDIGNADTPMTQGIKKGIIQADGSIKREPTFDPEHIADAVLHLVSLPLDTNILNMTIMASNMPFIGRG